VTMSVAELFDAITEAQEQGWGRAHGSLLDLASAAANAGAALVPTRLGDGPVGLLRPADPLGAHPSSLSAKYGMGCFPLHTDGAHLAEPPDLVALQMHSDSAAVATRLFKVDARTIGEEMWAALAQVMISVGSGHRARLVPIRVGNTIRFDPGCMRPVDRLGVRVFDLFRDSSDRAFRYSWTKGETILLIDNRRVLHGRDEVPADATRCLSRVMIRMPDG
jgi:hypothetical protein